MMEEGEILNDVNKKNRIIEEGERTPELIKRNHFQNIRIKRQKSKREEIEVRKKKKIRKIKKNTKKRVNQKRKKISQKNYRLAKKSKKSLEEQMQQQSIGIQQLQQEEDLIMKKCEEENIQDQVIEDEEVVFLRRRQIREELFKKLEQEIQASPKKENDQGFYF